jgi:serine/threonine protein kinase
MMELLGPMPKSYAMAGKQFENFFAKDGDKYTYRRIKGLSHFPLRKLLIEKYRLKQQEAEMFADFLMQMLKWYPSERATAQEMLEHPWLKMPDDYQFRMSDLEYKKFCLKQKIDNVNESPLKKDKFV